MTIRLCNRSLAIRTLTALSVESVAAKLTFPFDELGIEIR